MIVADTGAVIALIDAADRHHDALREIFERDPAAWILPWAILPEVDYLLLKYFGSRIEHEFLRDLSEGRWVIDRGHAEDLERAYNLCEQYSSLDLGLADAVVIATAERLHASAIATLDLRDFGAVELARGLRLLPRDL